MRASSACMHTRKTLLTDGGFRDLEFGIEDGLTRLEHWKNKCRLCLLGPNWAPRRKLRRCCFSSGAQQLHSGFVDFDTTIIRHVENFFLPACMNAQREGERGRERGRERERAREREAEIMSKQRNRERERARESEESAQVCVRLSNHSYFSFVRSHHTKI